MNTRLIPKLSVTACLCLLAGGHTAQLRADWVIRSSDTGLYSSAASYQTPPPGGWEAILESEMQQEQVRRQKESDESLGDGGTQADGETVQSGVQTCDDTDRFKVYNTPDTPAIKGQVDHANKTRRSKTTGRKRSRDRGGMSGFSMPWSGDRGVGGFSMPWGGDRGGSGFGSPWGGNGFGLSAPWERGSRGGRGARRISW